MTVSRHPYAREYDESVGIAFKARIRFFCGFTVLLYLAVSILGILVDPAAFRKEEFLIWAFLLAAAAASVASGRRAATLAGAKAPAAGFAAATIVSLAWLFIIYPDYLAQSSEIFALGVFLISFLMPWRTAEVAAIGAFATLLYTALSVWAIAGIPQFRAQLFSAGGFIDGAIFLVNAAVICTIIRMRDASRERKSFTLMKELEEKNAQMRRELAIARDIHRTLVPRSTTTDHATVAVSYVPLLAVGGDYATFHVTKEGDLFFLIGDVTGHGVPAALLVNRIYGEVESLAAKNPAPGVLMRELSAFVQEHFQATNMYFSVCAGLLDFRRQALFYSNYGHPPQILHQHREDRICLLESQTYFLGIDDESGGDGRSVFEGKLSFERGDRIILFTDGLIETKDAGGDMYGMTRLESFIRAHAGDRPATFNTNLLREIDGFRSGPVADDMFLVTVDIT